MPLNPHAAALATELAEDDHIAMVAIPTAGLAAEEGMTVEQWSVFRQEELLSIGAAIHELRQAGWILRVERLRDQPSAESVVVVHAERTPEPAR